MKQNELYTEKKVFEELKLVVFNLLEDVEKVTYAINAHKVREVVETKDFERLPQVYSPYIGILNLRNLPVPILDLNVVFKGSGSEFHDGKKEIYRIIICEILGKIIGIPVGQQIKMFEFSDEDVFAPDFAHANIKNQYISGFINQNGRYIFMINIESILDELEDDPENNKSKSINENFGGLKVLIVEDSLLYRKKLSQFLTKLNFNVTMANDGQEGYEMLKSKTFDIIFSDIEMPKMNGIEMIRKSKFENLLNNTKVLFHSSISNQNLINQLENEKLGDYITKFSEDAILNWCTKLK